MLRKNPPRRKIKMRENKIFEYLAFVCAGIAVVPVLYFLWNGLAESSQLRDAVVILVAFSLVIAVGGGIRPHAPNFSRKALWALASSLICLFFANFLLRPNFELLAQFVRVEFAWLLYTVAVFAGFALFIAATGFAFFDNDRFVYAVSGGFAAFSILSLALGFVDLPLRILAGRAAGSLISMFGAKVSLLFYKGEVPQIALYANGHPYLVATECNGFGIISSCLILAVLAAVFRRGLSVWGRVGIVVSGIAVGFAANTLRIVCIIGASLCFGDKFYYFYHEAIGYAFFGGALFLLSRFFLLKNSQLCAK